MLELSDAQWEALREFNKLVEEADSDLTDSFDSGFMSDSKSSVFAMMNAAAELDVPAELGGPLRDMTRKSWEGATSSGEVASRAGKAIAEVGNIERFLDAVCKAAGRAL